MGRERDTTRDSLVAFGAVVATRLPGVHGGWHASLPVTAVSVLAHGERTVAVVRCGNAAGLLAEARAARGTLRLTQPPSTNRAWLRVGRPTGAPAGLFTPVAGAQAETEGLIAFWRGFGGDYEDGDEHVATYEARLLGPGQAGTWINGGRVHEVHFSKLALQNGSLYTAEVQILRAWSVQLWRQAYACCQQRLSLQMDACAQHGPKADPQLVKCSSVGLGRVFAAAPCPAVSDIAALGLDVTTCLRYEVSVGRYVAGADVVRGIKTALPELAVSATRLLRVADLTVVDETVAYRVSVTAINAAGIGTTRHFAVEDAPQAC